MSAQLARVAFIGIGNMGWPMAARLVKAGVSVAVSDVTPGRADAFAKEIGGEAAHDLANAVAQADAIVTMLPTSQHVADALGGIDGSLKQGHLIIDMTSGLPATTRRLAETFGLDPSVMTDVLNASTRVNNAMQKKLKQFVLSRSFDSGFGLDLMKDLTIALDVGRDGAVPTPFAALCREMWASAAGMLGKGEDHTAVAKLSEALSGQTLGGAERLN